MPVLLIRHVQAGDRKEWHGDDSARPLSAKGRRQAEGLARMLEGYGVQRVLSSPYARCVQTVTPLAAALAVRVEETEDLAEGHEHDALRLVRQLADEKVALCTHGDVIPEVLIALADEDRLDLGPHPRQAKGSVWVLESDGGQYQRATYLPPPGT